MKSSYIGGWKVWIDKSKLGKRKKKSTKCWFKKNIAGTKGFENLRLIANFFDLWNFWILVWFFWLPSIFFAWYEVISMGSITFVFFSPLLCYILTFNLPVAIVNSLHTLVQVISYVLFLVLVFRIHRVFLKIVFSLWLEKTLDTVHKLCVGGKELQTLKTFAKKLFWTAENVLKHFKAYPGVSRPWNCNGNYQKLGRHLFFSIVCCRCVALTAV